MKKNEFRLGRRDYIKPDGLGVRRDGTFGVVEAKAVNDDPNLISATLQALCGALAIYAKRNMIVEIASEPLGRRPAASHSTIPEGVPSLGLYVLVDRVNYNWPGKPLAEMIAAVFQAFSPLREVVYFAVESGRPDFPTTLAIERVITRDMK